MTVPIHERAGYIAAADPAWLDFLYENEVDRFVYYKNPYNAPKLPIGSWFLCYRRGETPPQLHLAGLIAEIQELSLDNAWSRYGSALGVQNNTEWHLAARSILRSHITKVCCIVLEQPRWFTPSILLSELDLSISSGTGQMGQALSKRQIEDCEESLLAVPPVMELSVGSTSTQKLTPRREYTTFRVVRNSAMAEYVKVLYGDRCQICSLAIETPHGLYSEGAHIQPLGSPHNGPDVISNILCLCPNHHVMLDYGTISIEDDYSLLGLPGRLFVKSSHQLARKRLQYHRECIYQQYHEA